MTATVTNRDVTVSAATLLLSAADVTGVASLLWVRPYDNPNPTTGDDYLWMGSTDHAADVDGKLFRGYSASLTTPPTSWTVFEPPGSDWAQPETPWFVHNPGHARPYFVYYHPNNSASGGSQSSRLATYDTDWSNGTDEGEVLPATANLRSPILDHTGYMRVERESATVWHAWSLTRSSTEITQGYWTSTDGIAWTCVSDDVEAEAMMPTGRRMSLLVKRFTVGRHQFCILHTRPSSSTGGAAASADGRLVLCRVADETTFTAAQEIWRPADDAVTDDIRSVDVFPDPANPSLIHVYVAIAKTSVYYLTATIA